jgi:hypothetical protein
VEKVSWLQWLPCKSNDHTHPRKPVLIESPSQIFEVSIQREARPRQEYLDYARFISSPSARDRASAVPESPLYYPTGLSHTLARTQRCNEETLDLINYVRDLTQAVMDLEDASTADDLGATFGPKTARKAYTEVEVQALQRKKQRPNRDTRDSRRLCLRSDTTVRSTLRHSHPLQYASLDNCPEFSKSDRDTNQRSPSPHQSLELLG